MSEPIDRESDITSTQKPQTAFTEAGTVENPRAVGRHNRGAESDFINYGIDSNGPSSITPEAWWQFGLGA